MSRYRGIQSIKKGKKRIKPANQSIYVIRDGVISGTIAATRITLREGQRLDIIAANAYGDATLWWVIAAASGIGWQCQVPAGTVISIPSPDVVGTWS